MNPKKTVVLSFIVLLGVLLLLLLVSFDLHAPRLQAQQGALQVDGAAHKDALCMLAGWEEAENGYLLTLFVDKPQALCLYLPASNDFQLYIDGVDARGYAFGEYSVYMLEDAPADGDGYQLFLAAGEDQMPYLYLGGLQYALSAMQRTTYQRMFVVEVCAAALLYSTALFAYKPSEKYLIAFMALALITVLRTARQAFPQMDNYALLRFLNPSILQLPFLASWGNSMMYNLVHLFLLSWLRYKMAGVFASVKIGKYPYIVYIAAGSVCLVLLLVGGLHYKTAILLDTLLTTAGYCLELVVFARAYSRSSKGALALIFSCISALSMWGFIRLHQTALPLSGMAVTQWGVAGILQTVYMLGFLIAISGKFAQKFEEADILSHELEQANEGLERSVAEKTRELQISYAHLQDTQKQRDEFVANIAHNLKTPLFSLTGYADMLKSEVRTSPEKAYVRAEKISLNASYIKSMLDNLFLSMRLEDSKVVFHENVFALSDMLAQLRDTCAPKAKEKGVHIHLHVQEATNCYKGDSFYLKQAVQNMMDNAIEHCGQGGHVNLTLSQSEAGFCIAIEDDGGGISQEDLPHIFERYYSKSTNGHRGSGIGLAIARDIVAAHGGQIQVESTLGQGSAFRVFLAQ